MQATNPESTRAAKVYLWGYRSIVRRIEALTRERDRARRTVDRYDAAWQRATKATSRIQAVRVSGTSPDGGMAGAVLDIIRYKAAAKEDDGKLAALSGAIAHEIDAAADCLMVRLALIDRLSDERYKTVMVMRYVEGARWEKIAVDMSYSLDYIYELHGRALREIKGMMDEG